MGYYIETDTCHSKAEIICEKYGAKVVEKPLSFEDVPADQAIICVVNNGPFEAAAFCYSRDEFLVFADYPGDNRPKKWLLMDRKKAEELTGY